MGNLIIFLTKVSIETNWLRQTRNPTSEFALKGLVVQKTQARKSWAKNSQYRFDIQSIIIKVSSETNIPKTDWGKLEIPQVNSQERIRWCRDCKQGRIKQRISNTDWILNQSLIKATGETNNQTKLIEANLKPHKWIYSKGSGGTENVSKEGSSKESMSTSASARVQFSSSNLGALWCTMGRITNKFDIIQSLTKAIVFELIYL